MCVCWGGGEGAGLEGFTHGVGLNLEVVLHLPQAQAPCFRDCCRSCIPAVCWVCHRGVVPLVFFLYPIVTTSVLRVLHCTHVVEALGRGGQRWLVTAQPSLRCWGEGHFGPAALAVATGVVFVVGVPLAVWVHGAVHRRRSLPSSQPEPQQARAGKGAAEKVEAVQHGPSSRGEEELQGFFAGRAGLGAKSLSRGGGGGCVWFKYGSFAFRGGVGAQDLVSLQCRGNSPPPTHPVLSMCFSSPRYVDPVRAWWSLWPSLLCVSEQPLWLGW
jgi:hypothetical protein